MNNKLIFGKNDIKRIVNLEVQDEGIEVFIQDPDGFIKTEILDNYYWILSDRCLDQHFYPLAGNLHYKFMKKYTSRKAFSSDRRRFENEDIFSVWNSKEAAMLVHGLTYYKEMRHNEVSVLAFDIETTGLVHDYTAKILIISNTFTSQGKTIRKIFTYDDYENEGEMLKAWCQWVRDIDPSIMVGHNILMYDFPYINYIANRYGIELLLGRNDSAIQVDNYESKKRKDGSNFFNYKKVHIYGREVVDTLFLAYNYDIGRKYTSYGLKNIIKQEGLELANRQFYDASKIRFNYRDPVEWEKIKAYAEFDADDALNIYNLMCPAYFYMTQSVARSYQHVIESASGGQINTILNRAYLQDGHSIPKITPSNPFEGAISKGNPGIYSNCIKWDVASLYPSIILQYEIYDKEKDTKAYFLELVKTFTEKRLEYKKKAKLDPYFDDLQAAYKIFINSCYGFLGSAYNNFNYPIGASEITRHGREGLTKAIEWSENKGFKLVNCDTDSIMVCKADESEYTNEEQASLLKELNTLFPDKIHWELEGVFKRVIIVKPKNYLLFDGKNIKYKGSAIKATVKEQALQEFIKELLGAMLNGDYNFTCIYNKYVKEINDLKDITRWASKKTITEKVLKGTRKNETNVKDAIKKSEYAEGDKAYFFYNSNGDLELAENFNGDYDKDTLLEKLYNTTKTFSTVVEKDTFINYKLKRNKDKLCQIISI